MGTPIRWERHCVRYPKAPGWGGVGWGGVGWGEVGWGGVGWVQWTPRGRFCILESRMCPNVPGTPKPSIFIEVNGMSTNTHHVFFCCGGRGGGGAHLLHQSRQFGWPRHLLGIQQKQRLLCWYIYVCLTFQDSQLADFGLGGVYGSIPLRFRKKTAWDTIETPCFHDLWISGHLLGHLNHQELCLVNRICSNTTPNDL